jgi:hypothetical protein
MREVAERLRPWPWRQTLGFALLLNACAIGAPSSATPDPSAPGLAAASSGLCQAIAALPDRTAAQTAFTNVAHDALHRVAGDPALARSLAASVLVAMQAVEGDFGRSAAPAALDSDLRLLKDSADASLAAMGLDVPGCSS